MKKFSVFALTASLFAALLFVSCPTPEDPAKTEDSIYTVTIGTLQKGSIMANPEKGTEGTEIKLYLYPSEGYEYVPGSLKYDETPISDSGSQPYTFNLPAKNVTVTAAFEALPDGTYSVSIEPSVNGIITANPQNGSAGAEITLTFSPVAGYGLKADSLKITYNNGGSPVTPFESSLTGAKFIMPAAHVKVSAEFEQKSATDLIKVGTDALAENKFDTAIDAFEAAWQGNKNDPQAIVYSSLGKLAAIAKNQNVRSLMSDRLGIKNYPGTIDGLLNPDWLETYTEEQIVYWYYDEAAQRYLEWYDEDDDWFFEYHDLTPRSGYYRYTYIPGSYVFVSATPIYDKEGQIVYSYYDEAAKEYVQWYDENDDWFFEDHDLTPKSGYYRYTSGRTTYDFVSATPIYDTSESVLPGFSVPAWFQNTGIYTDSLTGGGLKSSATFSLLMFASLVDKNPDGLNALLDGLVSSVFGSAFDEAVTRFSGLNYTQTIEVDEKVLNAFGLSEIFEGDKISIGKAELNLLFSAMRIVKASVEWIAAYDWNTDISFMKFDWGKIMTEFDSHRPANLPLRNNFLKNRNNGMMVKSKADFIKAIDDSVAAYDHLIGSSSNYPDAAKDTLRDYQWIKDCLGKLKTAINNGSEFYINEPSGASYNNTAAGAFFGINMGKFFTAGQLSIDKLISFTGTGNSVSPKFFGTNDGETFTQISSKADIAQYQLVGFELNLAPVKQIVVTGFDDVPNTQQLALFPPEIGEALWGFYH